MDLAIAGLRVLVTAGASGIGLEIARAFVREGARVHVSDIDARRSKGLAAGDPTVTHSLGDVSDRAEWHASSRRRCKRSADSTCS